MVVRCAKTNLTGQKRRCERNRSANLSQPQPIVQTPFQTNNSGEMRVWIIRPSSHEIGLYGGMRRGNDATSKCPLLALNVSDSTTEWLTNHQTTIRHPPIPMKYTTPQEEELILTIATHPQLDAKCWEMITNADDIGAALERALAKLFPVKTRECRRNIFQKAVFWRNVLDSVELGLFKKSTQATILPVKPQTFQPLRCSSTHSLQCSSPQKMKTVSRHPLLEHLWWDEDTVFHAPSPVDDYLLMSHTS